MIPNSNGVSNERIPAGGRVCARHDALHDAAPQSPAQQQWNTHLH